MKYVAFDVMSLFQLSSALSIVLDKGNPGDEADIYIMKNLKGNYCSKEFVFSVDDIKVSIKHQNVDKYNKKHCFLKIFIFILGRFLFLRSKCFSVIHHTYFKPTSIFYFDLKSVFGLNVYSFEEGVGTYGGFFHHRKTIKTEGKKMAGLKYISRFFLSFLVHEKFSVLRILKNKNKILFSKSIRLISKLNVDDHDIDWLQYDRCKDNILFVSSPMLHRNDEDIARYKILLDKIKRIYSNSNIFIKLHPLEVDVGFLEEFDFFVLDGKLSGEYVVESLKPKVVIGPHSGLLLTAMNVYDAQSFVIDLGLDIDSSIRKIYKNIPEFNYD